MKREFRSAVRSGLLLLAGVTLAGAALAQGKPGTPPKDAITDMRAVFASPADIVSRGPKRSAITPVGICIST